MKPRITVNLTADGEFEIWLNPEGRDLLVRELQHLSEQSEHFHLAPDRWVKLNYRFDHIDLRTN